MNRRHPAALSTFRLLTALALTTLPGLLGAAPASAPAPDRTAAPADPPSEAATAATAAPRVALADAEKALARAKAEATAAFDGSDAGRAMAADVEARKKALADARAAGERKARLDATKAASAARAALEKARAAAVGEDRAVAAASEKVAAARAALDAADRKQAAAAEAERMRDPMNQAAAHGRILVGMTREQVKDAMRVTDKTMHGFESSDGDDGAKVETWHLNGGPPDELVFRNGLLAKIHGQP